MICIFLTCAFIIFLDIWLVENQTLINNMTNKAEAAGD